MAVVVGLAGCGSSGSGGSGPGPAACSWHLQRSGESADDLSGVAFPNDLHGWAVGGIDRPVIRVTTDGGATWRAQHAAGTNGLNSVAFTDDRHGWAVGVHNLLLVTTNGGGSWKPGNPDVSHDGNLYGITFVGARHGWIVGSGGVIRVTTNGGRTWTAERSGTGADLAHVQFTDLRHGWITTDNGEILRTTDGGTTWTRVYEGSAKDNEEVANVMFLTPQLGWIAGSRDDGFSNHGLVTKTTDGGQSWKATDVKQFDDVRFGDVDFTDSLHGWVTGYQGELWYSDDGGAHWGSRTTPAPALGEQINDMVFRDARHGWAVGESGTIEACTA